MDKTQQLEQKIEKLEQTVGLMQAKIEELDMSYALLLKVVEQEIDTGSLKLDMSCFHN
jgi:uncharacterized coiled-coil protein SlyX